MKQYMVTVMAADRVGIVAALAAAVEHLGGNIVEISQTVMRGFFTIILAAEFPPAVGASAVAGQIRQEASQFKLEVAIKDVAAEAARTVPPPPPPPEQCDRFLLTITGRDQPGVVRQVSQELAGQGVNIVDLYSAVRDGQFVMIAELDLPAAVDARRLARRLEELGKSFGLRAQLTHENIFLATNEPYPVRLPNTGAHKP